MKYQRIAICIDSGYEDFAITLLNQIIETDPLYKEKYYIEVVTNSGESLVGLQGFLLRKQFNFKVNYFDIELKSELFVQSHYPRAAYLKLFLGNIKIATDLEFYSNLIYLDVDLLLQNALSDLVAIAQTNLGDKICFAAIEEWNHNHCEEIQGIERYFNSGVMIINAAAWSSYNVGEKSLILFSQLGPLPMADQDYLNLILADSEYFGVLPERFNRIFASVFDQFDSDCIIHFAGSAKPWNTFGWNVVFSMWRQAHGKNFPAIRFSYGKIYAELIEIIRIRAYRVMLYLYLRYFKRLRKFSPTK